MGGPAGAPGYTTGGAGGGNDVQLPRGQDEQPWGTSGAVPYTMSPWDDPQGEMQLTAPMTPGWGGGTY